MEQSGRSWRDKGFFVVYRLVLMASYAERCQIKNMKELRADELSYRLLKQTYSYFVNDSL